ncbi:hypothetical protein KC332_g8325 [Hortaea werneckii]|uniref:Uncharacterized protein n=2 Tax=Hortaea werneckii TaxID=91943 RepID=A0A3M7J3X8_HORWE|nr:hypothetical protein KC358_g8159 [Hortaea werneckii]OTA31743.1 hypothetical protein BTJ68_08640 [Hortaea werneckii EXF-2000]KAI6829027.1 hypothetical protein KC350_g7951 [Hortaea werneckii]KAI6933344.1 hypothetical protein KC341_g8346 [Hortaea werneckii]KAI6945718.1 hypothetical protein KC348_g3627 [Hortaea werneckii]
MDKTQQQQQDADSEQQQQQPPPQPPPQLRPRPDLVAKPIPFLHPTRKGYEVWDSNNEKEGPADAANANATAAQYRWRARDNRKGRHPLVVQSRKGTEPPLSRTLARTARNILRMLYVYAWWDVSWWIGVLFSVGCVLFVIAGCFYWVPIAWPSTEFPGEELMAGGILSFLGATLFAVGGFLLVVEATNEKQTECFGWAVEKELFGGGGEEEEGEQSGGRRRSGQGRSSDFEVKSDGARSKQRLRPDPGQCSHHHQVGFRTAAAGVPRPSGQRRWQWLPSWDELRHHYIFEIGFLASFTLAIGTFVFWVSGLLALPGIYNHLSQGVLQGIYWLTYLVGGVLFVISSLLYMLETQEKWYLPAPHALGWWIGAFNMIGSVGWTLSAAFGYCTTSWCGYQGDLSLLWASIAYLIGSVLLWYEAMEKYPVVRMRSGDDSQA